LQDAIFERLGIICGISLTSRAHNVAGCTSSQPSFIAHTSHRRKKRRMGSYFRGLKTFTQRCGFLSSAPKSSWMRSSGIQKQQQQMQQQQIQMQQQQKQIQQMQLQIQQQQRSVDHQLADSNWAACCSGEHAAEG